MIQNLFLKNLLEAKNEVSNYINGKLNVDIGKMSQSEIELMIADKLSMYDDGGFGDQVFQRLSKHSYDKMDVFYEDLDDIDDHFDLRMGW